jgi:hypothetical protein
MAATQAEAQTETQKEIQTDTKAEATNPATATGKAPKATVLVPLYIYPLTEKTWQPLYEVYVSGSSCRSLAKALDLEAF